MHYQTSYQVDEELVALSAKQTFQKVYLKKRWIVILGFFIFGGLIFVFPGSSGDDHMTMVYVMITIGTILAITWVKAYFATISNTRSAFNATGGGLMQITIDDNLISLSSPAGSRKIQLDRVTRVLETKDFLILMADKTPVFTPLKKALNSEVETWLLNKN
jgi:hypothetical protein